MPASNEMIDAHFACLTDAFAWTDDLNCRARASLEAAHFNRVHSFGDDPS